MPLYVHIPSTSIRQTPLPRDAFPYHFCQVALPHHLHCNPQHGLPLLALALVGLAAGLGASGLHLAERVGALVKHLKVLASRVSGGRVLRRVRVVVEVLGVKVSVLLGYKATDSLVEEPDGDADDGCVLEGRLQKFIGLPKSKHKAARVCDICMGRDLHQEGTR